MSYTENAIKMMSASVPAEQAVSDQPCTNTIIFELRKQFIRRVDAATVASGSKNYLKARFETPLNDWCKPITAIFDSYTVLLDENNECFIPWEALSAPHTMAVSAFSADLHTAIVTPVVIEASGYISGETPEPPTPDVYEQLIQTAQNAVDIAQSVRDDADAGAFDGPPGPQGPKGDLTIDDTQASPDHPWSGAKVATELSKYAPLESALTVYGIGSDHVSLSPTIAWKMQGMILFGRTTQDGTPTPETPIPLVNAGDSGSIPAKVCGKNLLHYPYDHTTKTENGVTFTDNGDGSITIRGTTSASAFFHLMTYNLGELWWSSSYIMAPYVFSGVPETIKMEFNPKKKLTMIAIPSGVTIDATVYPQIEIGNTATEWEAPQKAQIVNVQTPNGLPGIPIDSGGNYTDSTGQQWICDEIDFARGVYIQRLLKKRLNPNGWVYSSATNRFYKQDQDYITSNVESGYEPCKGLCTHFIAAKSNYSTADKVMMFVNSTTRGFAFRYKELAGDLTLFTNFLTENEVYIIGVKNEPVEIALTQEELEAYSALVSYNDITNVVAQGCGVGATALANQNEYISGLIHRIAALESAATNI